MEDIVLADELIGTMLGNYRILALLGQGGMARVYRARQENLDREVAVKVLPPWFAADPNFVRRFNQEAKLVANLSHPNIVTVHDASEHRGHLYIVMQLVDGGTLKQRLDQLHGQGRSMDIMEAAPIFIQLASALDYAHEKGVIHRDVKPVNVLLDRTGRPILSDFGIAKALADNREQLTRPGAGVGTPEYMSPEQCQGGTVDGRADIYALGVMLYEALTGRTPFLGDNYPALAHSHIYEPPPRPSSINPIIQSAIEQIILTALMKDRLQRYQRASEMGNALEQALQMLPESRQLRKSSSVIGTPAIPPQTSAPSVQSNIPVNTPIAEVSPVLAQPQSPMYPCPNCYYMNKPQMRFCTRCGSPLNSCLTCGGQNPVSNRFCTRCGHPLRTY
ncbi:MAG TPA: serine/threonine-protein kinase [Ktedonobacteraceae bacterium]|nr:serine/threonine-protein kinase [Ktedonobacteraceae bacterium]